MKEFLSDAQIDRIIEIIKYASGNAEIPSKKRDKMIKDVRQSLPNWGMVNSIGQTVVYQENVCLRCLGTGKEIQ